MKKTVRRILIASASLVVLLATALGGARWWLGSVMNREALVAQMESAWNCRAEIDTVTLAFASSPARVEIRGVRLAARDAEVGKPLDTRQPLPPDATQINMQSAVLEIALQHLVTRHLDVRQLTIDGIAVRDRVDKEGTSSLAGLFKKPAALPASPPAAAPPPPPAAPAEKVVAAETAKMKPAEKIKKPRPARPEFKAAQLGLSIRVERASLERATIRILNGKNTTTTDITDLSFSISEIDIDPADLAAHNQFILTLGARIKIKDRVKSGNKDASGKDILKEVNTVDMAMRGGGTVRPFDPATGLWSPASALDLKIEKGSVLAGYMKLGDKADREFKKVEKWNFDLTDLRDVDIGGPLNEDANIRVRIEQDRISFLHDAVISLPDYEVTMRKDSWLNSAEDQAELLLRFSLEPDLQKAVVTRVGGLVDVLFKDFEKKLSDDRGRMFFLFKSEGKLSDPKIKFDTDDMLARLGAEEPDQK